MNLAQVSTKDAWLPKNYVAAIQALKDCYEIDECQKLADKAVAVKAYARQINDPKHLYFAQRIHGRAVRRVGELMAEIERGKGARKDKPHTPSGTRLTRSEAASEAGLSKRQKDQALRVASIPEAQFEKLIEQDKPPTVSELAEIGTKKRLDHLRTAAARPGFKEATYAIGAVKRFVQEPCGNDPALIAKGLSQKERRQMADWASVILRWVKDLQKAMEDQA